MTQKEKDIINTAVEKLKAAWIFMLLNAQNDEIVKAANLVSDVKWALITMGDNDV